MRHLNPETLARLVDEPAGPEEAEHLASCPRCSTELDALREQRDALASLPDLRPPSGDWSSLHRRLEAEGLVRGPASSTGPVQRSRFARSRWLQAAAALVLFLGGAGVGVAGARTLGPAPSGPSEAATTAALADVESPGEAADVLQEAEERYVSALLRYREVAGGDGAEAGDPASRYAALEALLAASQAAVRRAPTDPFINGVLVSTLAERQATLEQISTSNADNWF